MTCSGPTILSSGSSSFIAQSDQRQQGQSYNPYSIPSTVSDPSCDPSTPSKPRAPSYCSMTAGPPMSPSRYVRRQEGGAPPLTPTKSTIYHQPALSGGRASPVISNRSAVYPVAHTRPNAPTDIQPNYANQLQDINPLTPNDSDRMTPMSRSRPLMNPDYMNVTPDATPLTPSSRMAQQYPLFRVPPMTPNCVKQEVGPSTPSGSVSGRMTPQSRSVAATPVSMTPEFVNYDIVSMTPSGRMTPVMPHSSPYASQPDIVPLAPSGFMSVPVGRVTPVSQQSSRPMAKCYTDLDECKSQAMAGGRFVDDSSCSYHHMMVPPPSSVMNDRLVHSLPTSPRKYMTHHYMSDSPTPLYLNNAQIGNYHHADYNLEKTNKSKVLPKEVSRFFLISLFYYL